MVCLHDLFFYFLFFICSFVLFDFSYLLFFFSSSLSISHRVRIPLLLSCFSNDTSSLTCLFVSGCLVSLFNSVQSIPCMSSFHTHIYLIIPLLFNETILISMHHQTNTMASIIYLFSDSCSPHRPSSRYVICVISLYCY